MSRGRLRGAVAAAVVGVAVSGCSGFGSALQVVEGNAGVCQNSADPSEAVWFGTQVMNLTSRSIVFTEVRLGEAEGATLLDTVAIPEVLLADGTHQGLGTAHDLATDTPELWAVHEAVDGFVLQPGQNASLGLRITRSAGAAIANVASQDISYRVEGELFDRTSTSRLQLMIAADCGAVE